MRGSLFITASLFTAFQHLGVLAIPAVKVIPLGSTNCVNWPSWIPTRDADTTGSLQFQVDQSDDSAINELVTTTRTVQWGQASKEILGVDLRKSRRIAKNFYRCVNGTIRLAQPNSANQTFAPIRINKDNQNAHLTLSDGYDPEPYVHEIDGVRQPGIFLGARNQTTWGFSYIRPTECGGTDYYEAKLLSLPFDPKIEPVASSPSEFLGFLKIVPY